MFKRYYSYEVVRGSGNEFFCSGVLWVWFFSSPAFAYKKVLSAQTNKGITDFCIVNFKRIS